MRKYACLRTLTLPLNFCDNTDKTGKFFPSLDHLNGPCFLIAREFLPISNIMFTNFHWRNMPRTVNASSRKTTEIKLTANLERREKNIEYGKNLSQLVKTAGNIENIPQAQVHTCEVHRNCRMASCDRTYQLWKNDL